MPLSSPLPRIYLPPEKNRTPRKISKIAQNSIQEDKEKALISRLGRGALQKKRVPRVDKKKKKKKKKKKNRDSLPPTVRNPTQTPSKQPQHICRALGADPCRYCACHFSLSALL
jgi:hypothetical protein